MKRLDALLLPLFLAPGLAAGQSYCSPTFANGCFNWHTQSILVGTIDWNYEGDCSLTDYTGYSTTVNAGAQVPMTVTSGVWCGASVWVDFDQSLSFEDSENLFHAYAGGDPGYTYDFTIDIPMGTASGSYRMRVIGAWGSDGFTPGSGNGWGPCGSFQYGNWTDLTLTVDASTGVTEQDIPTLRAWPQPATDLLQIDLGAPSDGVQQLTVYTTDGRAVLEPMVSAGQQLVQLDLRALPAGLYLVQLGTDQVHRLRVMKL